MNRIDGCNAFEYLWSMPVEDRNITYMFFNENMNFHEIAERLNLDVVLVAKRFHEIRSSLTSRY